MDIQPKKCNDYEKLYLQKLLIKKEKILAETNHNLRENPNHKIVYTAIEPF